MEHQDAGATPWWRRDVVDWWDGLPVGAQWTVATSLLLIYSIAGIWLVQDGLARPAIAAALLVLAFAVGVVARVSAARRLGGWRQSLLYQRSVSNGDVPADADVLSWLPTARRAQRFSRRGLVFQRVLMVVLVIAAFAITILNAIVIDDENGWSSLPVVVLLALVAWGADVLWRKRRDQLDVFVPALEEAAQRDE